MSTALRWTVTLGVAFVILLIPRPAGIDVASWRLLAIFAATIVGSIVRPLPPAAVVLLGVTATALTGALTPAKALGGYADPIAWLVFAAMILSTAVQSTGLGRRIALLFIRAIGQSALGLAYALAGTDTLLAAFLPSNSARAGGIIFPVARSLAEAYDSKPGPTARRLGSYLLFSTYQCDVIACAMFLTGQISNVLAARFGREVAHVDLTYGRWLLGASVPAILALLLVPRLLLWWYPPEVLHTPEAPARAAAELKVLGPPSRYEWLTLVIFMTVGLIWATAAIHHLDYAVVALAGVASLVLTGVVSWESVTGDRGAWDVFIWYGGIVRMAGALSEAQLTTRFAEWSAGLTVGWPWGAALAALALVYVYAHYGFASITAHVSAMFTPFLVVLLAAGAPAALAVAVLAYSGNLSASLTHYGTTPAPIYFGAGYVSQRDWWRLGLALSVVTLTIFGTVGLAWWRLLGWW